MTSPAFGTARTTRLGRLILATAGLFLLYACQAPEMREGLGPEPFDPSDTTVTRVVLSADSVLVDVAASYQFQSWGQLASGDTVPVNPAWSATGGTVSNSGAFQAGDEGNFQVTATARNNEHPSDTARVYVRWLRMSALQLSPATLTVTPGTTRQFSVVGNLNTGGTVNPSVTYSATGGSINTAGLYTAGGAPGTYRVVARLPFSNMADTTVVVVQDNTPAPVLASVILSPSSATVEVSQSRQFSVSGSMTDGSVVTPAVNYSATGGTITTGGLFTAGSSAGTFRVIAVQQGGTIADTSAVTVTAAPTPEPTLQSITMTPASASLQTGTTRQFTVSGTMSDGSTVTPAVTWSATGGTVTASGLFTAGSTAGTFRVIARQTGGTIADTAAVTLTAPAPTLQSITLSPGTASLQTGGTQQFTVSGRMSDGSTVTPTVNWSASGGSMSGSAVYTAGANAGNFRVIISSGSLADTTNVTVTAPAPTLVGIEITPTNVSLLGGLTQQFSAIGRMSNNSTTPVTVTWRATSGIMTALGLFTAPLTDGTVRVIATETSGFVDTSVVSVSILPTGGAAPEPTGSSVMLHQDAMENGTSGYATRGSISSVPGRNGNALRFSYTSASPDNLIEKNFTGSTDVYVRYWYRINTSGQINSIGGASGMKWFMLWRSSGPRYTNGVGNLGMCGQGSDYPASNCNTGLEFSVHDNGSTQQPNPYFQNVSKGKTFKSTADGGWHKYTLHIVAGAGGYEEMWIDDVKVLDSRGKGYDHDAGAFGMFQLPGLVVGGCCSPNFSIDVDDLALWRN